jgi:hypothetical protein
MKAQQIAFDNIRKSIDTADRLSMKSSAVLVADLKILLKIAEAAINQSAPVAGRSSTIPVAGGLNAAAGTIQQQGNVAAEAS